MGPFDRSKEDEEQGKLFEKSKKLSDKVAIFPGNIREYEEFVGYRVEVIDTGRRNKGITFSASRKHYKEKLEPIIEEDIDFFTSIVKKGLEAIVNVQFSFSEERGKYQIYGDNYYFYGLPVRKKTNIVQKDDGHQEIIG